MLTRCLCCHETSLGLDYLANNARDSKKGTQLIRRRDRDISVELNRLTSMNDDGVGEKYRLPNGMFRNFVSTCSVVTSP